MLIKDEEWYNQGWKDGMTAFRCRGGHRGAEWWALQHKLLGCNKEDYILGFNDALDLSEESRNEVEEY